MEHRVRTRRSDGRARAMKGPAGQGVDATLAAIATLTAAWPVSTLLAEPTWLRGTVLLLATIAISGVIARSLSLRGWQVLIVQLVCSVLAASAIYGRGRLWHGLPTFETLGVAGRLVREALVTVRSYAAPAPSTPGLIFVVGCALGLIALAVDYLAVTRRSPPLAGLPLLTAFLAAAANSGSALPVIFFVAAGSMWLILVARAGSTFLRRWGTTVSVARTPAPQSPDSQGVYAYASRARMLGAAALVAAVAVPVVLPQLPPTFLVSGLGRQSSPNSSGPGTVGFSLSLNLAADLSSPSTAPLLQYKTADPSPPPLRVAVSAFYESDQGVWIPERERQLALSRNPSVPGPTGLATDVPKKPFAMSFDRNLLDEPNLAAPYPMISADLGNIPWGLSFQTQTVRVAKRPDSYAVSYWRLEPTATMLRSPSASARVPAANNNDLILDDRSANTITALTEKLTTGKSSAYDKALAIQQYLRATGGFTYSLTPAPPTKDQFGNDAGFDPLTNFLVTKQGYCVQFATAMVMMSRAAGIPARMAIGFLPGTEAKGVWTVTASQAHTWPELYLDGIGWSRFEPTPSRGSPPAYAIPPTPAGTPAIGSAPDQATKPAPPSTARKVLGVPSAGDGTSPVVGLSPTSAIRWLTHGWGLGLLGSLVGLLGSLVVPSAARWRRRRSLITARTAAQRVEVQWGLLTSSLGDLGIAPAPSRTPRQLHAYYDREAFLEGAASQALGRVVQTLERSRYAVSAPNTDGLSADTRQVLRAAAASRRGKDRLRAALWPSSGIAQLRSSRADFAWRVQAPLRDVRGIARQRFPRRHTGRSHPHRA
jgi:transglutaminase-like putative cysteine protease